ncbi:MAG: M48 family metallopeptidase [Desulfobacter sp.]|nr:MAG: M48 family metallopeptidase [Desulfobacter sp.]
MISIKGRYYDGKTSRTVEAALTISADGRRCAVLTPDGTKMETENFSRINISPRLAHTPRYLYFPGGAKFETHDNEGVDGIMAEAGRGSWTDMVHFLESRMPYVLAALAVLLVFIWGTVRYGVPAASNAIAHCLPASTLSYAGVRTLDFLDKSVFKPSTLDEETKDRILNHFQPVLDAHMDQGIKIIFRQGGRIGPNAFALPDGTVIFTDEMVETAQHDDELLAVLLHETGHIIHRHGLRTVIQDSLLGFALLAFTGDVSGSAELFMGLPLFLTQMAYSRGFELEADQYALNGLRRSDIPLHRFADLMDRIEKKMRQKRNTAGNGKKWTSYLSTHPRMAERLKPFRGE